MTYYCSSKIALTIPFIVVFSSKVDATMYYIKPPSSLAQLSVLDELINEIQPDEMHMNYYIPSTRDSCFPNFLGLNTDLHC